MCFIISAYINFLAHSSFASKYTASHILVSSNLLNSDFEPQNFLNSTDLNNNYVHFYEDLINSL